MTSERDAKYTQESRTMRADIIMSKWNAENTLPANRSEWWWRWRVRQLQASANPYTGQHRHAVQRTKISYGGSRKAKATIRWYFTFVINSNRAYCTHSEQKIRLFLDQLIHYTHCHINEQKQKTINCFLSCINATALFGLFCVIIFHMLRSIYFFDFFAILMTEHWNKYRVHAHVYASKMAIPLQRRVR